MSAKKVTIAILVENNANVLSRISMLFGRRGYNIDSLTVSATNDPDILRAASCPSTSSPAIDACVVRSLGRRVENITTSSPAASI